jgi:hypothetical protein
MPTETAEAVSAALLQRGRQLLEAGSLAEVLALLQTLPLATLPQAQQMEARVLQCRAAFRAGEHALAIESASRLLEHSDADSEAGLAARFDALAVLVLSAGELAHFELSLERLPEMMTLASRRRDLVHWVRARGTAASALCLLGDPWAARRVLLHVRDCLAGAEGQQRFAPTVHNNLTSIELLVARMARDAGDPEAEASALERARAAATLAARVAAGSGEGRLQALAVGHALELDILSGNCRAETLAALAEPMAAAAARGQVAQLRHYLLLRAEAQLGVGAAEAAVPDLQRVDALAHEGTELSMRIRVRQLLARAFRELGQWQAASLQACEAEGLGRVLSWRLASAQSTHSRIRLELEHLFLARPFSG